MASVWSDVSRPRTISTSGSTGTGLKKWSPRKRSGLPEARPSVEIEIDEVFEAKIDDGGEIVANSWNSADFGSGFSTIASMTRSAFAASAIVPGLRLARKLAMSSGERRPVSASRCQRDAIAARSPLQAAEIGIDQCRLDAGLGDDLSDPAAHGPRTDDQHPCDGRGLGNSLPSRSYPGSVAPCVCRLALVRLYVPGQ